jgi:hypothetical protein
MCLFDAGAGIVRVKFCVSLAEVVDRDVVGSSLQSCPWMYLLCFASTGSL